jgi:hypothetical protein
MTTTTPTPVATKPKRKRKAKKEAPTWHTIHVTNDTTFGEIKQQMREHVVEGVICPCCELPAKVYKRKLNSSMAYVLLLMVGEYDMNGGAFMHVPSMINRKRLKPKVAASLRGDYAKLRYWGLIEQEKMPKKPQGEDRHKKTSGNWRPTWQGIQFAKGEINVASHAIIYGKRCMRLTEQTTTSVKDSLGDKWDYNELMAWTDP